MKCIPKITLVTNKGIQDTNEYLNEIKYWLENGINGVQLREKILTKVELIEFGLKLKALLDNFQVPLIVNDHIDVCLELDAAGVHLGQDDHNSSQARQILGEHKIIGLSTNNFEQIKIANLLPIDYIGIGAIFPTSNKPNIETIWGIENLAAAVRLSSKPILAIGGINFINAASIIKTGVHGWAGIGAFTIF